MIEQEKITAQCYAKMIASGAGNLKEHVQEINDLNVFPIPDGDTGENMLLTMLGGAKLKDVEEGNLGKISQRISDEMLLSARGNSGVILSQFFSGINEGFKNAQDADVNILKSAFELGVKKAYGSVMTPTEGTILTVIREATEYASQSQAKTPIDFLDCFLKEAKSSLKRTPELLPVLKEAGVVDSGGAGLVYIVEGMKMAMLGKEIGTVLAKQETSEEIDYSSFDENSELTYGYCTEALVRLQWAKCNIDEIKADDIEENLSKIGGDSIVAIKNDSVLKIHVHTFTPYKVLEYLQNFGEFLKVKIENMSLQHNSIVKEQPKELKEYGVVCVCTGEGVKELFQGLGADVIVEGGQSMNPSAQELLSAIKKANAKTVIVYPNNKNVILTAKQAKELCAECEVIVIESHNIGQGYSSLSMLDTSLNKESMVEELKNAMDGVKVVEITQAVRESCLNGKDIKKNDFIAISDKEVLSSCEKVVSCFAESLENVNFKECFSAIILCGKGAKEETTTEIETTLQREYPNQEIYIVDGQQEIYDYILIIQ